MAGIERCAAEIKKSILMDIQNIPTENEIINAKDRVKHIICELLSEAYKKAEKYAKTVIENEIIEKESYGISKNDTLANLRNKYLEYIQKANNRLNNAIRFYNSLPDNEKTKVSYIDFLTEIVYSVYIDGFNFTKDYIDSTNKSKYEFRESRCFNYFVNTFAPFEIIKILRSQQQSPPEQNTTNTDNKEPKQITIPKKILLLLQEEGFIENAEAQPLKWTTTNKKTSKPDNLQPSKRPLIDLLCLLGYPDEIIKDIKLLNKYFTFPNNKPIKANNRTPITERNGKLKRPIISEYHKELEAIVKQNK